MTVRSGAFVVVALLLGACSGAEPDVARTAADPAATGAPVASGSGVLRPDFDPQSLAPDAPAAPAGSAADPHAHHHHP